MWKKSNIYSVRKIKTWGLGLILTICSLNLSQEVSAKTTEATGLSGVIVQKSFKERYELGLGLGGGYRYDSEEDNKNIFIPPIVPLDLHLSRKGEKVDWRVGGLDNDRIEFGQGVFSVGGTGGFYIGNAGDDKKWHVIAGSREVLENRPERVKNDQDEDDKTSNVTIMGISTPNLYQRKGYSLGASLQNYDAQGLFSIDLTKPFAKSHDNARVPFIEIGYAGNRSKTDRGAFEVYGEGFWAMIGLNSVWNSKLSSRFAGSKFLSNPEAYSRPERPFFDSKIQSFFQYKLTFKTTLGFGGTYSYDLTQGTGWVTGAGSVTHAFSQKWVSTMNLGASDKDTLTNIFFLCVFVYRI